MFSLCQVLKLRLISARVFQTFISKSGIRYIDIQHLVPAVGDFSPRRCAVGEGLKKVKFMPLTKLNKVALPQMALLPTDTSPEWHLPQLAIPPTGPNCKFLCAIENLSPPAAGTSNPTSDCKDSLNRSNSMNKVA